MDYSLRPQCILRAQERSGIVNPDLFSEIIDNTAGKSPFGIVTYRPYWAAAEALDQRRNAIESAEGAKFRDVQRIIDALRRMQWSIDISLGLVVPPGTSASSSRRVGALRTRIVPLDSSVV